MAGSAAAEKPAPTAAVLVIGDEILSGRTKDRNIGFIADTLTDVGIDLKEVRIVADEEEAIAEAVRALSRRYDFVFTSGGIGPTHDDITADSVAKAFGLAIDVDQRAVDLLTPFWKGRGIEPNEARLRMARIPDGARLIPNSVSAAPGFVVENVFVMAGVPAIMQAMMDEVVKMLPAARPVLSETIEAHRGEGDIAAPAAAVQAAFPSVRIGSYPYHDGQKFTTRLVLRSRDAKALAAATAAMREELQRLATKATARA
jgi:molybdenum cofactor synthesis domain-containing protein